MLQSQEAWFPLVVVRQAAEGQAGLETAKSTDSTLLTASGRQASREPGRSTDTLTHTHTNTHTHTDRARTARERQGRQRSFSSELPRDDRRDHRCWLRERQDPGNRPRDPVAEWLGLQREARGHC